MNAIQIKNANILIVFNDLIADMEKLQSIVTEIFIRSRKIKISLVFITGCYFSIPKNIINSAHYLIMKIPNKREFQQIALSELLSLIPTLKTL